MTDKTDNRDAKLVPAHGGYKKLGAFKNATIVYDFTMDFCRKYKSYITYKTYEQMIGAGRSGKQNMAEGSVISGTSKKGELKLMNIARGSLAELLEDYEDFLRQNGFKQWGKNDPRSLAVRQLAYESYKTCKTYMQFLTAPETAANAMVTLINQTNYLLDRLIARLGKDFLEKGGFTERMYRTRQAHRDKMYTTYKAKD